MSETLYIAGQYFLNHLLREEELVGQHAMLAEAGYQEVYAHARSGLRTPYLSEAWFEAIDVLVRESRKNRIALAIWDEDYYPSPVAGNRIIWEHPQLQAQSLEFSSFQVKNGEVLEAHFPHEATVLGCFAIPEDGGEILDVTAFCGSLRERWTSRRRVYGAYSNYAKIGSHHWRTSMEDKRFGILWHAPERCGYTVVAVQVCRHGGRHNSDILNPETGRRFLEYTHERYYQRYRKDFAEVFTSCFMDEPAPNGIFPWTGKFPEEFTADHGYDLLPQLAHLYCDIDDRTPVVRHHYRLTQSRLQCESYLDQIRNWAHEHGIKSCGHLTRTEWLSLVATHWPNELRCCRHLDIPCTDPLGFFTALPDASAYHTGIKVVTSAARLFGKKQAGSDAMAVMGDETTLRDLAYAFDYQMVLGITYFNIHGLSYSLDGPRKDEVPPPLFYQHSEWQVMGDLLREVREKCEKLSAGHPVRRLLVLYPSSTFYCRVNGETAKCDQELELEFHQLAEQLLSTHHDFDFIDEVTLVEKTPEELRRDYDVLLFYHLGWIDHAAAAQSTAFARHGGRLLAIKSIPMLLGEIRAEKWQEEIPLIPELDEATLAALPGVCVAGEGNAQILVQEREIAGKRTFFLFNRAMRNFAGSIEGIPFELAPGASVFVDESTRREEMVVRMVATLESDWRVSFADNQLAAGFWEYRVDDEFYGKQVDLLERQNPAIADSVRKVVYSYRFLCSGTPDRMQLVFDESAFAGKSHQFFLNGQSSGDSHLQPLWDARQYTCDLTGLVKGGDMAALNLLEIVCTEGDRLLEMPFLYGNFQAEFRHGHHSLPELHYRSTAFFQLPFPQDWRNLGYGTFSGVADYRRRIEIKTEGDYILDLGIVRDSAEVFLDGKKIGVLFRPPYQLSLGRLKPGSYELQLLLRNSPANRDRLTHLSAGLQGSCKLLQTT